VAGTLGARTVQSQAADLEAALRHEAPPEHTADVLARLHISLDEAVRAMYGLLDEARPGPDGTTSAAVPQDTKDNAHVAVPAVAPVVAPVVPPVVPADAPAGSGSGLPDNDLTDGNVARDGVADGPPHALPDALSGALPDALPDAFLDRLEALIEEDDSEAVDLFNTHAEALRAALGQPLVTGMGEALRAFEFEAALEMLRSARPARDG
ncbi:hypothetical protein FVW27_07065, partial [Desulfovibrio sp. XJ01]|nr:hypothetical protein [Nitratidesulfovibrio liaohensis]